MADASILSDLRRKIIALALILGCFPTAHAQDPEAVNAPTRAILDAAIEHDNGVHFATTLEIALRADPDNAQNIIAYARQIGGDHLVDVERIAAANPGPVTLTAGAEQPEPEAMGPAPDPDPAAGRQSGLLSLGAWGGDVELGFSASTGDTSERAFAFGLELNRTYSSIWEHHFNLFADVARRAGVVSKELYRSDYQLHYRKWDRLFLFAQINFEYDRFSGFDYRLAESIGIGYQILDNDRNKWSFEGGPGLRQTKLELGSTEVEALAVLNSSYRHFFSETVSAGNETNLFIGEARTSVNTNFDIRARLINALSARFSFNLRFDSEVPLGTHRTDTLTKITLVYDF